MEEFYIKYHMTTLINDKINYWYMYMWYIWISWFLLATSMVTKKYRIRWIGTDRTGLFINLFFKKDLNFQKNLKKIRSGDQWPETHTHFLILKIFELSHAINEYQMKNDMITELVCGLNIEFIIHTETSTMCSNFGFN